MQKKTQKMRNHHYSQENFEIQETILKSQANIFSRYQTSHINPFFYTVEGGTVFTEYLFATWYY